MVTETRSKKMLAQKNEMESKVSNCSVNTKAKYFINYRYTFNFSRGRKTRMLYSLKQRRLFLEKKNGGGGEEDPAVTKNDKVSSRICYENI